MISLSLGDGWDKGGLISKSVSESISIPRMGIENGIEQCQQTVEKIVCSNLFSIVEEQAVILIPSPGSCPSLPVSIIVSAHGN